MAKRRKSRVYCRDRGGELRYYGDFRDFSDVGGKREPLTPAGSALATSDRDVAERLSGQRVKELEQKRRNRDVLGIEREKNLADYAAYHLEQKAKSGEVTTPWLESTERHLAAAVGFFGSERGLDTILVEHVQRFSTWLAEQPNRRGGNLSAGTRRQFLNSLSNLFRRAAGEGYVPPGFNPVAALMHKPQAARREARWLEVSDAALILESARTYRPDRADAIPAPMLHALLATYLLCGARETEVRGLELEDLSFDRRTITFRPNRWRRLKTQTSHRAVPMWPQLETILREYVFGGSGAPRRLVFPAPRVPQEQMITDFRKALDAVATRVGWKTGEIRSKMFRHTYCAARLQTLDRGAPVSEFTVAKELGHGGFQLVRKVYGHLGTVRHRSEVVEYRVEQHLEAVGDRLQLLRG